MNRMAHPVSLKQTGRSTRPANRMPREATVDARYLLSIAAGAQGAGIDVNPMLRRCGIDPLIVTKPGARVAHSAFDEFLRLLTKVTRDELWFIGRQKIRPGTFHTMSRLTLACSTLGEALREGARFYHLMTNSFRVRLSVSGPDARISISATHENLALRSRLDGTILLFVYGMLCQLAGKRVPLKAVHNAFPARHQIADLDKIYRAPIVFDQLVSELVVSKDVLNWPIPIDMKDKEHFLASLPRSLIVRYDVDIGFVKFTKNILRRNVKEDLSFETVAAMLAVSSQTLRRRLKDEGSAGFQEIKDDVRRELAFDALRNSTASIEEIAIMLGFSEVSAFHRAFRRWSDLTPRQFRGSAGMAAADAAGAYQATLPEVR